MKKNSLIITIVIIAVLICAGGFLWYDGFWPVQGGGVSDVTTKGEKDVIKVTSPKVGVKVSSPVVITGTARGQWYFEASFPISVVDWDGKIIGQGIAQAQTDWATSSFVAFKAVIDFDTSQISNNYSNKGAIILKKDNPSGLPANDDSLEIPIIFK